MHWISKFLIYHLSKSQHIAFCLLKIKGVFNGQELMKALWTKRIGFLSDWKFMKFSWVWHMASVTVEYLMKNELILQMNRWATNYWAMVSTLYPNQCWKILALLIYSIFHSFNCSCQIWHLFTKNKNQVK